MFPDHLWPTHGQSGPVFAWQVKNSRFLTQSLYQSVFLPCVFSSDFGWDRWAGHQNLSAPWCRLWRRRGVQGADQGPEGQTVGRHHKFWVLSMFPFFFFSLYDTCFTDVYVTVVGEYSLRCDWLQPADRGEGEEDPWSSLPLGCCWGGEPRTQRLPQTTHHACVSLTVKLLTITPESFKKYSQNPLFSSWKQTVKHLPQERISAAV